MKRKQLLILAIAGSAMVTGCKKDYLETRPTQFVTPEQLADASRQDPGLLNGNLSGLYSTMYTTGVGGTTGHDDFGQKGIDIYTDMLASDMVLGALNYGWYSGIARYQATTNFTLNAAYVPWRYYYRQIYGANTVIDALGGTNAVPPSAEGKATMGQAKAMRAYAYFYLAQLYAKEYGTGGDKILPVYTDTKVPNQPKSTAKQVYDLMVSDLTQAITYLQGFQRTTKDQVNQNVAKGLLAYVLSARGTQADWQQVETLTQDIMTAFPMTDSNYAVARFDASNRVVNPESGFNNVSTPSWMWGVDLTLDQGLDLVSWWGQVDVYTYSYAWAGDPKPIDRGLYTSIRTDDIRRRQFHATNLQPRNKFFHPARVIGGQREVTTDYVYMRADEFYLMNAEAKARLGKDNEARQVLTNFLAQRIADRSYISALSGQALLDEIYRQTRIELWGEGKSYLALKRFKGTVVRGTNHLSDVGVPIPYNDDKITFDIPQAEVLNNPVLNN